MLGSAARRQEFGLTLLCISHFGSVCRRMFLWSELLNGGAGLGLEAVSCSSLGCARKVQTPVSQGCSKELFPGIGLGGL